MALTWTFSFDWDNNGVFEANEGDRATYLTVERGRRGYVKPDGSGFERPRPGRAIFDLDNYDGRFDPLNSSSPIYPDVRPGREVLIQVNDGATTYDVFKGAIGVPIPKEGATYKKTRFVAEDGWRFLFDRTTRKEIQEDKRTDQCIDYILTDIGWPAAWGDSLGTGADTLPYWWVDGQSAADAIMDLVESEMGQFYIAVDNEANFIGRHALYNGASAVTLNQTQLLNEPIIPFPYEVIRNIIRIRVHPKTEAATAVLWTLDETPAIAPGSTYTVFAEYTKDDVVVPAKSVVTPVATTDYTANSEAGGGGSDMTSDVSITFTKFGTTAKLEVENTNVSDTLYLTKLQVRGDAVYTANVGLVERDESAGSDFDPRVLELDLPWQQDVYTAEDLSYWLASFLPDPSSFPRIQFLDRSTIQFAHDLYTRLTLGVTALGVSDDYYIGYVFHEWLDDNGQGVRTEWRLEPVDTATYWKFPTKLGQTSKFAY